MTKVMGTALALALAASSLAASLAWAEPAASRESVGVRIADVNLTSEEGAATALRRIKRAASSLCGGDASRFADVRSLQRYRSCVRATTADAVAELDAPLVTALHAAQAAPHAAASDQLAQNR